jgi:hypothetical protein
MKSLFITISMIFLQLVIMPFSVCNAADSSKKPTATIVDDETGNPIEGAVAIAIWRKHSMTAGAWFEGGAEVPSRIVETVSDKDGNIYVPDFWNWHMSWRRYPRLTVYKPGGYLCWDQKYIYISAFKWEERKDFSKESNIIRMKKWPKDIKFSSHDIFIDTCTSNDYRDAENKLFLKAIEYETPFCIKEDNKYIRSPGGRFDNEIK